MQLPKTISLESASRQNQGESRPPLRLKIKATAASEDGPIKAIFIEQPLVANRGLRAWLEAAGDEEQVLLIASRQPRQTRTRPA
jgi:hypothetical protein